MARFRQKYFHTLKPHTRRSDGKFSPWIVFTVRKIKSLILELSASFTQCKPLLQYGVWLFDLDPFQDSTPNFFGIVQRPNGQVDVIASFVNL